MFSIGLLLGATLAAPTFFGVGWCAARARRVTHERADIRPALRRSAP